MQLWRSCGFAVLTVFWTAIATAHADNEKVFRAGAHAMDVTPTEFPISMNGNMQDNPATKAHDPIHARCLVLDDGAHRLAIVVVDSCAIPREVIDEARKLAAERTGIPAAHMLISATHTHSAPAVAAAFQTDGNPKYAKFLAVRIAEGIERALKNLLPARIGWAVGRDETQVFNRRWKLKEGRPGRNPFGLADKVVMNPGYSHPDVFEPAGPVDPDVSIISVQTLNEQPIALLANYSLHYVGGTEKGELSADYFAVFAERIGQLIGANRLSDEKLPPFVGIMSNGTSGDVNNLNFALKTPPKFAPYEKMRLVAESVAQAAKAAYDEIEYHTWVPIDVRETELELGVRRPTNEDIIAAKEILAKTKDPVLKTMPEVYARETLLMASYPETVKARLQVIRLGDLGIAAIPCEVFAEIGLDIKQRSPLTTFTIELANGYNGYLPTPAQHALGGYETWRARSSYLEVDASTKIVDAVLSLLVASRGPSVTDQKKPEPELNGWPLVVFDDFEEGNADRWEQSAAEAWSIDVQDENHVYSQFKHVVTKTPHRSPFNRALIKDLYVSDCVLDVKLQSTVKDYAHRSLCLFFGYQDPAHMYYVHFGKKADDHANQIFIVNAADRKKISTESTPGTDWDDAWHHARVVRNVETGSIEVYFDDMNKPVMKAVDKTFTWGQVGIGSFDDTGNFDEVAVYGTRVDKPKATK